MFQLKSNPSDKEEREAQSQLTKSDEIQRLVAQAHRSFDSQDYVTAATQLDTIIEVRCLPCQHCLIFLQAQYCPILSALLSVLSICMVTSTAVCKSYCPPVADLCLGCDLS